MLPQSTSERETAGGVSMAGLLGALTKRMPGGFAKRARGGDQQYRSVSCSGFNLQRLADLSPTWIADLLGPSSSLDP